MKIPTKHIKPAGLYILAGIIISTLSGFVVSQPLKASFRPNSDGFVCHHVEIRTDRGWPTSYASDQVTSHKPVESRGPCVLPIVEMPSYDVDQVIQMDKFLLNTLFWALIATLASRLYVALRHAKK